MWVSRVVEAPAAHVWRVLIDTTTWTRWGPSVSEVRHQGRFLGPGSRGQIRPPVGPWLDFDVTRFEEGHLWSWSVAGVPATAHRVVSIDARRCQVGIDVPLLVAPYALVGAVALQRIDRLARESALSRPRRTALP
ncbi:MAG: SRPBCC family protein [Acidimicrobiia bacterium]|nr:SRPBCC family protein [Acidimicrobiia bacterium]